MKEPESHEESRQPLTAEESFDLRSIVMEYDVLTIDTSTIKKLGYRFDSGLLDQLSQFKNNDTLLIFSDVVVREMEKHITDDISEAREKHKNSLKELRKKSAMDNASIQKINDLLDVQLPVDELANNIIESFLDKTDALVIDSVQITSDQLLNRYFNTKPPFENTSAKKNEFPDAIALLALEKWGSFNGRKVLAVSEDKGWVSYGEESEIIDVQTDLATALNIINSFDMSKKINDVLHFALEDIMNNEQSEQREELLFEIEGQTNEVDATSIGYSTEATVISAFSGVTLSYNSVSFQEQKPSKLKVVNRQDRAITVQIPIIANARAITTFVLLRNVTGYEITPGAFITSEEKFEQDASKDFTFPANLLLTLEIDTLRDSSEIAEIEIIDTPASFDFGDINEEQRNYTLLHLR
ncbi:PIN domain-containing protein [Dyadobacter sp. CY312]|uniref:PIN domain-containing protein n=1 Tax=Dyadobacter sp. CY312 TaxID=2907303 RepID=UPI001F1B8186|nr:PIN domain-containing protein [Dyadobacter sp. CY312]MCE7038970.1 PIN domain-containing protein [Dyadobacter sp. CY312]